MRGAYDCRACNAESLLKVNLQASARQEPIGNTQPEVFPSGSCLPLLLEIAVASIHTYRRVTPATLRDGDCSYKTLIAWL